MDNAQLLLGLAVALILWPFGRKIGFFGLVGGVQFFGQFLGLILMGLSLTFRYKGFHPRNWRLRFSDSGSPRPSFSAPLL